MRARALAAVWLAAVACGHEDPFQAGAYGPAGPYNPGTQVRLTFSAADDRMASWVPGSGAVWYSYRRGDRRDRDFCLGLLPAAGGARIADRCHRTVAAEDSTDVLEAPSVGPDGRLAFVHITGRIGTVAPDGGELAVAGAGAGPARRAMRLPAPTPGRRSYDRATNIRWLAPDSLVFLAELWAPVRIPFTPFYDTVTSGVGIEVLALRDSVPVRVPGTDWASSVALGDTAGALYYTVSGEARVYRLQLAAGVVDTVYDFGGLGIARDVQVRGGRLVAVVGGAVSAGLDPNLGAFVQRDGGGFLYVVDLPGGFLLPVGDTALRYRRPALAADGRSVVVEGSLPGGRPDLYRVDLP